MVGLALVSMVSVVADSVKKSFTDQLKASVTADFFVTNLSFQGLPVAFGERLAELPELGSVSPFRATVALVNGEEKQIGAVKPEMGDLVDIDIQKGSINTLNDGNILLYKDPARDLNVDVGDTVDITWQNGTTSTLTVGAIYADSSVAGNWLISLDTLAAVSSAPPVDFFIGADIAEGVSIEDARAAVEKVAADFPSAEVQDRPNSKRAKKTNSISYFPLFTACSFSRSSLRYSESPTPWHCLFSSAPASSAFYAPLV
jgi:putative ABC transport system permease protein